MVKFTFAHNCLKVFDLDRSLKFYKEALGLEPVRWMRPNDQDIQLVFLSDGCSAHELELGCPADRNTPFDLGDNEFHVAFRTADMDGAHKLHESMGCICYDPETEPVYFIQDPDGYQIEIIPAD
jgi:lactoylglutathione lyase